MSPTISWRRIHFVKHVFKHRHPGHLIILHNLMLEILGSVFDPALVFHLIPLRQMLICNLICSFGFHTCNV